MITPLYSVNKPDNFVHSYQKNPINDLISDKDLMQLQLRYRFNE